MPMSQLGEHLRPVYLDKSPWETILHHPCTTSSPSSLERRCTAWRPCTCTYRKKSIATGDAIAADTALAAIQCILFGSSRITGGGSTMANTCAGTATIVTRVSGVMTAVVNTALSIAKNTTTTVGTTTGIPATKADAANGERFR